MKIDYVNPFPPPVTIPAAAQQRISALVSSLVNKGVAGIVNLTLPARAFRQEVQMTPTEYVEAGRLEMARRLAEDAKIPMEKVASQSGFIGTIALRRAFVRKFWVSPFDYRKSFAQ